MRNVGSQLAEYFEAATERIDAEDVLVRAAVNHQADAAPGRTRLRPAWAAALGFVGALVLIGGALLAGVLMRDPAVVEPRPVGSPATVPGAGWGWWPLVVGAAAAVISVIVLVFRRLRRATKEVEMQATETRHPERTEAQRRPRRLGWMIGLTVLAVALIGGGIWAIVEANQVDDIEIATDLVDDWIAGWNASDPEAIAALFVADARETARVSAQRFTTEMANIVRTSDLVATEAARTYRFTIEFDWSAYAYSGEFEIELDGDLVGRMEATEPFNPLHPFDDQ